MAIIRETAEMSETERLTVRNSNMEFLFNSMWSRIYPIGSIYISANSTSPATLFGGTWVQIKDTFLLAAGTTYTAGTTGGEAEHTLTVDELPENIGTFRTLSWNSDNAATGAFSMTEQLADRADTTGNLYGTAQYKLSGGGHAHNNMPPYLAVYMWKRIA